MSLGAISVARALILQSWKRRSRKRAANWLRNMLIQTGPTLSDGEGNESQGNGRRLSNDGRVSGRGADPAFGVHAMSVMSQIDAETRDLRAEVEHAFHIYISLLEASSPVTRTAQQEHDIHLARLDALAARDRLDFARHWGGA